jgi:pimeloyl-ACP methyl ester carboxylesterase
MLDPRPYRVSARDPESRRPGVYPAWTDGSWDPKDYALLTVFVYGFNNDPGDEWDRWSKKTWPGIKPLITPHSDGGIPGQHGVILFSWPGDSNHLADAFGLVLYPAKIRPAIESGVELAKYLKKIASCNKGLHVQVVGHSLGCRVVLSAVEELAREPQEVQVVRVLLMGAAVPERDCTGQGPWPMKVRDLFSAPQGYKFAASSDIILYSSNDEILKWNFIIGESAAKPKNVKSLGFHKAVGLTGGPYPKRWTGVVDSCGLRHSEYLTDPTALMHVADLFGTLAYRQLPARPEDTRLLDQRQPGWRQMESATRMG